MTSQPSSRYVTRLRLSQFRNYAAAALDLDARHVVLVGPNGAGKTNLMEAISLLSPGRGLRRAGFDLLAQHGSSGQWAVATSIETPDGEVDLGTGAGDNDGPRRVRINGANAKSVESLTEYLRLLWLTPDMDGLFRGPASDRRRFLDRLVMTLIPSHSSAVSDFEKLMRQRNRLLEEDGDGAWLSAIEAQMATAAAAVHYSRVDCLVHLQQFARDSVDTDAFPAASLSLSSLIEGRDESIASSQLEDELISLWAAERFRDRAAGRTLIGPHRVDFEVTHSQKAMPAALCSTGEQKALLLGLILAHARLVKAMTGMTPILLLDEIAAHLDPDRRAALFNALDALATQCWMTGTDPILFEALKDRAQLFSVASGQVSAL